MQSRKIASRQRPRKGKHPPGRPRKTFDHTMFYDEQGFFNAVQARFTSKELSIFKPTNRRLKILAKAHRLRCELYPKDEQVIKDIVNKIKASSIRVGYMQECLGMKANDYNAFMNYVKKDSVCDKSILAAKNYAIIQYYKERYEIRQGKLVIQDGMADNGITFELFEDLIKIRIYDFEALLSKFQKRRQGPKRICP